MSATAQWPALGTSAVVVVTDDAALPAARAAVERELDAIDRACSRFRADSELTALNAAGGRPVQVGPLLAQAIAVALRAARATGGIVDPTLGAELRQAGYDRDFAAIPADAEELTSAGDPRYLDDLPSHSLSRSAGGWRDVELDAARRVVRAPAGVELDLGAT
ncbi:MAG: apbE, partial [Conexibacter sp.]|nr:apbE [Conexibacter sp.]